MEAHSSQRPSAAGSEYVARRAAAFRAKLRAGIHDNPFQVIIMHKTGRPFPGD